MNDKLFIPLPAEGGLEEGGAGQVGLSVSLKGYGENKQYVCLFFNYRVRNTSLRWKWGGCRGVKHHPFANSPETLLTADSTPHFTLLLRLNLEQSRHLLLC